MTTPLRKPRDGCVPMPMMSIPSGVTSPTMQQIFVVPMSRPTIISPFFWAITSPLRRQLSTPPLRASLVVQVDLRRALSAPGERRAHLREAMQLLRKSGAAEPDLLHAVAVAREERRAVVAIEAQLGELAD